MARRPPAPPPSPTHSSHSEAVSIINHSTEERDAQTFRDLCKSRVDLLHAQYHILKDTLHKVMGIADVWWGADKANDLDQQAKLGSKLIDEIVYPYFEKVKVLLEEHEDRFNEDDVLRNYSEFCADAVWQCFTPIDGMDFQQALAEKGLTVRLSEVDEIRAVLTVCRKKWGRKTLLEKGVRDHGLARILKKPVTAPTVTTWSLLWAEHENSEDEMLWAITPLKDIEGHQRDAFKGIRDERVSLLQEKIELAEDYWDSKLAVEEDDLLLDDDDEDEWVGAFENSFVKPFELVVQNTKLRLMRENNMSNFRFLGPLTSRVSFEEDLHLTTLLGLKKKDRGGFVIYRLELLEAEKERVEKLQFVPLNNTDE